MYKFFAGTIDRPDLLGSYSLFTLTIDNTRSKSVFHLSLRVTNHTNDNPSNRTMKHVNELDIDMSMSSNFYSFKTYCNFMFLILLNKYVLYIRMYFFYCYNCIQIFINMFI